MQVQGHPERSKDAAESGVFAESKDPYAVQCAGGVATRSHYDHSLKFPAESETVSE